MKIIIIAFIIWIVLVALFMSLFKAAARGDRFLEENEDNEQK